MNMLLGAAIDCHDWDVIGVWESLFFFHLKKKKKCELVIDKTLGKKMHRIRSLFALEADNVNAHCQLLSSLTISSCH